MPPAEARMWNALRAAAFDIWHFRRQVPLGSYLADFVSHAAKLVIEIDGDTHAARAAVEYDRRRDNFMREQGFEIVRVTNGDVMNSLEGVLTILVSSLVAHPHPTPSGPPS